MANIHDTYNRLTVIKQNTIVKYDNANTAFVHGETVVYMI